MLKLKQFEKLLLLRNFFCFKIALLSTFFLLLFQIAAQNDVKHAPRIKLHHTLLFFSVVSGSNESRLFVSNSTVSTPNLKLFLIK